MTVVSQFRLKFAFKIENITAAGLVIPEELIQAAMKVKPSLIVRQFMGGDKCEDECA